jgi:hypothetical protein
MKRNPKAEGRRAKEGRMSRAEDRGKAENREPKWLALEDAALRGLVLRPGVAWTVGGHAECNSAIQQIVNLRYEAGRVWRAIK